MSKSLKDCCDFQEGYVNPSQKNRDFFGGNILWLRTLDLVDIYIDDTSQKLTIAGYKSAGKSAKMFPENSIAINKSGTIIGAVSVLKKPMCGNRAIIDIVVHDDTSFMYIYYLLKYKHDEVNKKAVGSIQKNLYVSALGTITLTTDDYEEQKKIAKVLQSLDDKIYNNKQICAELEAMAKLIYDYWFVQFDFPDEHGRPYKSSGGAMVWNEALRREIPKGWECVPFEKCISSINTGLNPRDNFKLNTGGTIKYITVKNLTMNGTIDFSSCDMIDEEARIIVHRRSDIQVGDILFASISPLGRCHLITEKPVDWDINESVFSVRPNNKIITSIFLYMTFISESFVKKAERNSAGSVFKGLRITELQRLDTILPPKHVLVAFDKQLKCLFEMNSTIFNENQHLAALRDFLLPLLMNGQVTVREAEKTAP